jgi:hypothetical protein
MKQMLIIKTIIFVVFFAVMTAVVMTSCSTGRVGCPINAQHGFGPGRIR